MVTIINRFRFKLSKPIFLITFSICLFVGLEHLEAIGSTIRFVIGLFTPFMIGAALAFVINIPLNFIEKQLISRIPWKPIQKQCRSISVFTTLFIVLSFLIIIVLLIIPQFNTSINMLANNVQSYMDTIGTWFTTTINKFPQLQTLFEEWNLNWPNITDTVTSFLQESAHGILLSSIDLFSSIISRLMSTMISIVFCLYILFQKEKLCCQFKQVAYAFLQKKHGDKVIAACQLCNETFAHFISGQCVEAVILGVIYFVLLTVLKFPYPIVISLFIALMSLIPVLGSYISSYTSAFLILTISPIRAIWFLILFAVVSQIDINFIYPHVVQNAVGLPSIWIIMSVSIGGSLFGIIGMITFIPICSILYSLFRNQVKRRLIKNEISPDLYRNHS